MIWHAASIDSVLDELAASQTGLSTQEAATRLARHGPNALAPGARTSAVAVLARQFKNALIVILAAATLLSVIVGHGTESLAIAAILLLAVVLGFAQEYRAERAIDALRRLAAPTATVLRDGQEVELPAHVLVPGDMVRISVGDRIPADVRLVESANLRIEESSLTGESVPVEKVAGTLAPADAALGDRINMAYAGTAVAYGRGRAVVVATGAQTEFGKVAGMLQSVEAGRSPLQENLDRVGSALARAAVVIVALIVGIGLLRGQPFVEMLIFGIALAVAVVPEALPAVVTISLAIGVQRMARRNALVRKLSAVETLGCTSVICSDKTGTLTRDEMTVRQLYVAGGRVDVSGVGYEPQGRFAPDDAAPGSPVQDMLRAAALACDAQVVFDGAEQRWHVHGDPTEGALIVAAAKAGLAKTGLDAQYPRVDEIPFSSESKRMTTLHASDGGVVACAKGAPEIILGSCTHERIAGGDAPLSASGRERILQAAAGMASGAMRVLAIAARSGATRENAEAGLTFLGLAGMIDPPRPEGRDAIALCELAGIRPIMITGDHPATAQAVARELGLLRKGRVITGAQIEALDDAELEREVADLEVCARVSQAHKLRVVTALQKRGEVVAMTGDGVNDAPALKKADIGVAMGITGTDVAKEAAAMTLTDDNFASIVAAVEEGRGIFDNIRKYLMYLLSSNIGEIGLMAGAALAGLPLPLSAVQILYVNLATDGLPALALAIDPPADDLMQRKPRDPRTGIFTRPVVALMLVGGVWSTLLNLGLFAWSVAAGGTLEHAMTLTFVTLVLIEFFKAFNFRSDRLSVFRAPFANRWLNIAVLGQLGALALIIEVPLLRAFFGLAALPATEWLLAAALAATVTPVLEIAKWVIRRSA